MSVILSHPTANSFVRAAVRALHADHNLEAFYTTVSTSSALTRLMPDALRQRLRRSFTEVPAERIRTYPVRELVRLASSAIGVRRLSRPGGWASVDAVYEGFDRHVAQAISALPPDSRVSAVYGYEDGAEHTFRAARQRGLACVYELPIAFWQTTQRLLREEAERFPEWRATLYGIDDSPEKLARKDSELESTDVVVVPSRFVFDSLPASVVRSKLCLIAPFGSPPPRVRQDRAGDGTNSPRLRVLFAGAMTQRKGLADLFTAMGLLNRPDVELVVMGSLLAPLAFYRQQCADFTYERPRSHARVLALMQTCDVLVLPAIVEGRALVQQEALASGMPILVTKNAGGEDLVDEARTGFLVPIRSPEAIAERITWFLDNRPLLPEMRQSAIAKARATSWSNYEGQVRQAVAQAVARVASGASIIGGMTAHSTHESLSSRGCPHAE